ncbi:MAG: hypothetical protein VB085_13465 [Peptococcaceae bacterium]|nr:hypothetical protein [Peptococcaceae bacterium]
MAFSIMRMTTPGKDIWAAAQAGLGLELTRVAVGSGILPTGGSMINRSALISEEMSLPISDVIIGSASASALVEVLLSNAVLDAGFYFREVGIFARHPTTGTEVLYLYDNSSPDQEWIPDKTGLPVREYFRFQIAAAEASTITFDSSGAPGELTIDDIQDEYASPGKLWSSEKIAAALSSLSGAGRTTETVMGAYAAAASADAAAADAAADASAAAADAAAAQAAAVAARAKVKSYTLAVASWTGSGSTWRQTGTFPGLTDDYVLSWSWTTQADGQACVDAELMLDASASGGSATLTWTAKNKPTAAIAVFVSAYLPVAV